MSIFDYSASIRHLEQVKIPGFPFRNSGGHNNDAHAKSPENLMTKKLQKFCTITGLLLLSSNLDVSRCVETSNYSNQALGANSLSLLLDSSKSLPAADLVSTLREFHDKAREREKSETAYVLARALQKQVSGTPKGTVKSDQASSPATPPITGAAAESIALFEEASEIAALFERCQWHICEVATSINDEEILRKAMSAVMEHSKSVKTRALAQYSLAQSYLRSGEKDKARNLFLAVRKEAPGTPQFLGSGYYLAEEVLAATDNDESSKDNFLQAIQLYRDYLKHSPDGRFAANILSRLQQLQQQAKITFTSEDQELLGQVCFNRGDWSGALGHWQAAGPDVRPFSKSICLTNLKRFDEATDVLLNGIRLNLDSKHYINAANHLAGPLSKEQTIKLWRDILALKPKYSDAALWNIATRVSGAEARGYFQRILAEYPTSEFAPESVWWLFWNDIKDGAKQNYSRALALAETGVAKYPQTKATAKLAFWSGKLYEQSGKKDLARKSYEIAHSRFPDYYYGWRAKQRLDALTSHKDIAWQTDPARKHPDLTWSWPVPASVPNEEFLETYGKAFAELHKLHQYDECLELLPANSNPSMHSWLLAQEGAYLNAIAIASRHVKGSPKRQSQWEGSYPLAYASDVASNAEQKSVDPYLVHALIREESRYNSQAVSRSKALGLMQLMPGTAYGVAKRIGVPLSDQQDILRPEINIRLGTDYLSYAIRRFNGNALLAVASYNGGPGAVQSWMKKHDATGSTDFDVFVENIPYRETRDYVRKVFGSYWTYLSIYANKKQDEPS